MNKAQAVSALQELAADLQEETSIAGNKLANYFQAIGFASEYLKGKWLEDPEQSVEIEER